ncbi:chemotaxis protein CheX [Proteinivorax tanatarense]|uniref:Chemotaxis protein CheX n=1 Tax=Proteinivorax tanatarense TaxID=1260629 RepID=A0AAU7VMP3_9FIRM
MNAEFVNPFYQATTEVFKMMLDLDVSKDNIIQPASNKGDNAVSVKIDVTGDLSGVIIYRFPKQMPIEMIKIMSGMDIDTIDSFVTSALKEVTNIISGNAATNLSSSRYDCDISTPKVYIDKAPEIPKDTTSLALPLQTSIGEMEIDIALK